MKGNYVLNHIPHTDPSNPEDTTYSQHGTLINSYIEDDYSELRDILEEAFEFAAVGKGAERHGNGKPWKDQHHFEIADHFGQGFALGQAEKKCRESTGLEWPAARRELLGAITYIASAIYAGDQGIN